MQTFLGIDGGGTATRWALCDASGAVLASGELGAVSGLLTQPGEQARLTEVAAGLAGALGGRQPQLVVAGITGLSATAPEAAEAARVLAAALRVPPEIGTGR